MKIKVIERTTEIECDANELRQSRTVSDNFLARINDVLNPYVEESGTEEDEEEE